MKTAREMSMAVGPCWGDGISGPKQCDESFQCELHHNIEIAIQDAERMARVDAMQDWYLKANEGMNKHQYDLGVAAERERCAKIAENTYIDNLRSQSHEGLRLSIADAIREGK